MTRLEDRQTLIREIAEARANGARQAPACALAGIDPRTLQRWRKNDGLTRGDRRPDAIRPAPSHALTEEERARIVEVANEPRFAETPPARIVPMLADEGVYIASESSFHRVLRAHGQMNRRGRARPPRRSRPPTTHIATRPGEVWCWDVTFLPATVQGRWFYLYLILDLYSRKIVGFEVHDTDSADHAAHLARRTALAEGVHAMPVRPFLHGDNGATLKGTTVLAMLHWLGIEPSYSRPRVSDDNPYAEACSAPPNTGRIPGQRLRRTRCGTGMGGALRPLVQRRTSAQRHPIRDSGTASCRPGSRVCWPAGTNSTSGHASPTHDAGAARPATGRRSRRSRSIRSATAVIQTASPRNQLSGSAKAPAFLSRPDNASCHGAQRRGREEHSRPEPRTAPASARAWRGRRAPDLPRSEHHGTLTPWSAPGSTA